MFFLTLPVLVMYAENMFEIDHIEHTRGVRGMMQEMRLQEIMSIISKTHYARVEELARSFNVSSMTIRRDLALLSARGKVERCYGGARSVLKVVREAHCEQKLDQNHNEKVQLACVAVALLQPDDVVYLDSGTTIREIAKLIPDKIPSVVTVTNDLYIASMLADSKVSVTIIGGLVSPMTKSALGRASESFLSQFRFSKAFLGASCIDVNFDTFSPDYDKAFLKRHAIDLSEESYLVVDKSKFYSTAMSYVTSLNQYTGVITNKDFNETEMDLIHKKRIRLIR